MYRALVISAMAGAALGGAIAPKTDIPSQQSHTMHLAGPLAPAENSQNSVYTSSSQQKDQSPSSQYYYPTYPVYPSDSGYGVQTGYEGYLIPTEPAAVATKTSSWPFSILTALVPLSKFALIYGARAGAFFSSLVVVVALVAALVAGACSFTPLCTISFLKLGLNKNQVRDQVSELARTYITPESVNAATMLVQKAIDKYAELQRQQRAAEEKEKDAQDAKRRRR